MGMGQVGLPLTVWRAPGGGLSIVAVAYALRGGDLITVLFMAETYKKFKVSNNNLKKDTDKFKKQKKV
jgi:hypothetical protein